MTARSPSIRSLKSVPRPVYHGYRRRHLLAPRISVSPPLDGAYAYPGPSSSSDGANRRHHPYTDRERDRDIKMSPRERKRGHGERRMNFPNALSTASTSTGSGSGSAASSAGCASRRSGVRARWASSRDRALSISTHHHPASADRHCSGRDAHVGVYNGGSKAYYGTPVSSLRETAYLCAIGWTSAGAGAGVPSTSDPLLLSVVRLASAPVRSPGARASLKHAPCQLHRAAEEGPPRREMAGLNARGGDGCP